MTYDNSGTHFRIELVDRNGNSKMIGNGQFQLLSERLLRYRLLGQKSYKIKQNGESQGAYWSSTERNSRNEIVIISRDEGFSEQRCVLKDEFIRRTQFTYGLLKGVSENKYCLNV